MKLSQLKTGYIIVNSSKKGEYEYAAPSSMQVAGILSNGALINNGEAKVYVYGSIGAGGSIRSRVNGDGGMVGQAVSISSGFSSSYIRIGTALEAGRNKLISVALDIRYVASSTSDAEGAFETISKNLISYPYVITYTGDDIHYITYSLGGNTIVKTFNYTLGVLTNIVLSGDIPSTLTKTLVYTGDNLTSVTYS